MKRYFSFFIILLLTFSELSAQLGGSSIYQFVNLSSSARVAAMGGSQIAVKDDDVFLGIDNPALLNKKMSNKVGLSYVSYLADINYGTATYAYDFEEIGTFNLGVKYMDYGKFIEFDQSGQEVGDFTAGEYAFIVGYGKEVDSNFSIGVNLKTIYSSFYDNTSIGFLADVGMLYQFVEQDLTFALLGKNIGAQLTTYSESAGREKMPFEIQFALTKRLDKVPIRLGLLFQHVQKWDLTNENPNLQNKSSIFGLDDQNEKENKSEFFENLGKHLVFNAEFLLTENFNVRLGYNYLRRSELKVEEKLGTIGISWGFGMRVSKFHLSFARSAYHQSASTNTFSVSTNISDFFN